MSRIIKFRVWAKYAEKYVQFSNGIQYDRLAINFDGRIYSGKYDCCFNSEDYVIQQFTGLKDKNGKEIYEGDIVKYDGEEDLHSYLPGVVSIGEYFTHTFAFCHFGARVKRIDMDSYYSLADSNKDHRVIGNIFETPELLNNGQNS